MVKADGSRVADVELTFVQLILSIDDCHWYVKIIVPVELPGVAVNGFGSPPVQIVWLLPIEPGDKM